jgi:hypothetical protein
MLNTLAVSRASQHEKFRGVLKTFEAAIGNVVLTDAWKLVKNGTAGSSFQPKCKSNTAKMRCNYIATSHVARDSL